MPDHQVLGIDVSGYQTNVDWTQLAASGVSFAFVKATEGSALVDHRFAQHWADAKSYGLLRGAYHFFRPQLDAATQARLFIAQLQDRGELPPVIDVETAGVVPADQTLAGVKTWIEFVTSSIGRPLLYTMPGFWDTLPLDPWFATHADLWIANWGVTTPVAARGFPSWTFWQFTNRASFNGLPSATAVDGNRFNGTLSELRAYSQTFVRALPALGPSQFNLSTTLGVQYALNYLQLPMPLLTTDGLMGPRTRAAITLFQQQNGLAVDGIVGQRTRAAIQTALQYAAPQVA
jgi:lysozyme